MANAVELAQGYLGNLREMAHQTPSHILFLFCLSTVLSSLVFVRLLTFLSITAANPL